jgi:oligopeptide/dipeptide ABC transporter ATP-binding protein
LDEPTSAIDVSVQAQILNLLQELRREFHLTYLFISHNMGVVRHISDRIAVMYLGKVVELSTSETLFSGAFHPYTEALLSSTPIPDPDAKKKRIILEGGVPSSVNPPPGCRFHPRCPNARSLCSQVEPKLFDIGNGHLVACHRYLEPE